MNNLIDFSHPHTADPAAGRTLTCKISAVDTDGRPVHCPAPAVLIDPNHFRAWPVCWAHRAHFTPCTGGCDWEHRFEAVPLTISRPLTIGETKTLLDQLAGRAGGTPGASS